MDNKNMIIGVLAVITVVSLVFAFNSSITGKAVNPIKDSGNTGILEVRPAGPSVEVDVYVDGEFAFTVPENKRPYYEITPGIHEITVKGEGHEDWVETVEITAREYTTIYPWLE